MGRTGKWFAHQNFIRGEALGRPVPFTPDIIAFAKGVASGMPLGGIIAKETLIGHWTSGAHASTFGGNPISCAAALATIEVIEEEDLLHNAYTQGQYLARLLGTLEDSYPVFDNSRGIGLMRAIDLPLDNNQRNKLLMKCFEKGLILLGCGKHGIRFCPALNVTREEIETCVCILEDSIKELI
jgi:4-aminobutyrate aminotransferase